MTGTVTRTNAQPRRRRLGSSTGDNPGVVPWRARHLALLLLIHVLPALCIAPGAHAQQSRDSFNYTRSSGISVEQAAAMVRRETGGRVLSANPVKKGGQRGFEVRVLIDGKRVRQYYVDSEGRMSPK